MESIDLIKELTAAGCEQRRKPSDMVVAYNRKKPSRIPKRIYISVLSNPLKNWRGSNPISANLRVVVLRLI